MEVAAPRRGRGSSLPHSLACTAIGAAALGSHVRLHGRATVAFNERDKVIERLKFLVINPDKLTASQMQVFKLVWHDLVQFTNQSLVIPPFRREPP